MVCQFDFLCQDAISNEVIDDVDVLVFQVDWCVVSCANSSVIVHPNSDGFRNSRIV